MEPLSDLYKPSMAMLTDLYELTMAYGYWKLGRDNEQAAFSLFFRKSPFSGGYTLAAGLEYVVDLLRHFRFAADDLAYLASLRGNDGRALFEGQFLEFLSRLELSCDVDAIPEGTVVFPLEPLVRVTGSLLQCQLLESAMLNVINFQSLIATKASRVCASAHGEPVLEFGLRRAQGPDGGISASRAAYVGGCEGTSNVMAGKLFDIPVRGTHAHSWVMSFPTEDAAFAGYGKAMPNNCVFLVDTFDTLSGIRNAIVAATRLRDAGHKLAGIRLDSGDLAYLSTEARRLLDDAGFKDALIIGSNELDENIIDAIKQQGACINVWGVGTNLVTGADEGALGGVYKLGAIRANASLPWQLRVKVSDQTAKTTIPGILQVRRYIEHDGLFSGDMIFDEGVYGPPKTDGESWIIDPADATRRKHISAGAAHEDLLVPVFRGGSCIYQLPALAEIRARAQQQLLRLHPAIRRLRHPHEYPAGLEQRLHEGRMGMIAQARAALRGGT